MAELSLDVRTDGSERVVIVVAGEVDMASAPQLADCLNHYPNTNVIVDLSGVTLLDSSGINVLVHAYKRLRATGRSLQTTGEHDIVLRVLEVSGLADTFHGESTASADDDDPRD